MIVWSAASGQDGDLDGRARGVADQVEGALELLERELVRADLVHRQHTGLQELDRGGQQPGPRWAPRTSSSLSSLMIDQSTVTSEPKTEYST